MARQAANKWVHIMFATCNGEALIGAQCEQAIHLNLAEQLAKLHCKAEAINGMPDHVHILFGLTRPTPIHTIVERVKEESCLWINGQGICASDFSWQKGFGMFSLSGREINSMKAYIENQKVVHQSISYKEEYMLYLRLNML